MTEASPIFPNIPHDAADAEEFSGAWGVKYNFSSRASARTVSQFLSDQVAIRGRGESLSSLAEDRLLSLFLPEGNRARKYVAETLYHASKHGSGILHAAVSLFLDLADCDGFLDTAWLQGVLELVGGLLDECSLIVDYPLLPGYKALDSRECVTEGVRRFADALRILVDEGEEDKRELALIANRMLEELDAGDQAAFVGLLTDLLTTFNAADYNCVVHQFCKMMAKALSCIALVDERPVHRCLWLRLLPRVCDVIDEAEEEWLESLEDEDDDGDGVNYVSYEMCDGWYAFVPDDWGILHEDRAKSCCFGVVMTARAAEFAELSGPTAVLAFTEVPASKLTPEQLDKLAEEAGTLNPGLLKAHRDAVPLVFDEDGHPTNAAEHLDAPELGFFDLPERAFVMQFSDGGASGMDVAFKHRVS